MKIEKDNEIKILYENKKYELNEQELDRVIALASKMLRCENAIDFINFEDEIEIEVFKQGHKSELYGEMKAELIYALEEGMLDNYEKKEAKEERKQKTIIEVQRPKQTRQTKKIRQVKQIIPLISPVWRIRTISDNIFRPVYSLD